MHNDPAVYVMTYGGNSWMLSINSLEAKQDVLIKGSRGWFIPNPADHFYIKYTEDSGTTWVQQLFEASGFYVLDKARNGNTLWSGTGNGKVYIYHDLVAGIETEVH